MTRHDTLYRGISRAAWGYLFLYFDLTVGGVSILPALVGYALFLSVISLLEGEERELSLLRPLGVILFLWNSASWLLSCGGIVLDEFSPFLNLAVGIINLYFHFQLITNLASIARIYQQEGAGLDEKLLKYRTLQTLMLTVVLAINSFSEWLSEVWVFISVGTSIVYLVASICLMRALFQLRRSLRTDIE